MTYVKTRDGVNLYVKDWGIGPAVVLIHGWPLDSDMWEHQAVDLARAGLRVVSYDRRGFGRSDQPWQGYDYDTFADDLAAVMDDRDLHAATLVGFSMGGGEVARYAARHGLRRVARAAFVAAVTPYLLKSSDNPDGAPQSLFDDMFNGVKKDRPQFLMDFAGKFYNQSLLDHKVSGGVLQQTLAMALRGSPKATQDCVRAFSETDFRRDLAAVNVPALVIHGTADKVVPIDLGGRAAVKLLAQGRMVEYEGEPHGLTATAPDRLTGDLLNFVQGG